MTFLIPIAVWYAIGFISLAYVLGIKTLFNREQFPYLCWGAYLGPIVIAVVVMDNGADDDV